MRRRQAFTLVELLVVMAIIAVLVGILLPALSTARYLAKRTVCAAHVRGMMMGHLIYVDDNRGDFPVRTPHPDIGMGHGIYCVWHSTKAYNQYKGYMAEGILANLGYIDNPEILYCPAWEDHAYMFGYRKHGWPPDESKTFVSYGYHYRSTLGWAGDGDKRMLRATDPGGWAVLADAFTVRWGGWDDPPVDHHHLRGYNTGYVDGHVKFVDDPTERVFAIHGQWVLNVNWTPMENVWRQVFDYQ